MSTPSEQRGREDRAIGDAAGEVAARPSPNRMVSHDRMHAVGADHGVGLDAWPLAKLSRTPCGRLVDAGQPVIEPDQLGRHGARQRRMQVAAMGQQIGRAVVLSAAGPNIMSNSTSPVSPVPVVPRARIEGVGAQPRLEAQPAQHVHGVAADLDAGAEPRELPGLLVDRDCGRPCAAPRPRQARPCRRRRSRCRVCLSCQQALHAAVRARLQRRRLVAQRGSAIGQRGWKRQPGGIWRGRAGCRPGRRPARRGPARASAPRRAAPLCRDARARGTASRSARARRCGRDTSPPPRSRHARPPRDCG